jgi:hypothetical protein
VQPRPNDEAVGDVAPCFAFHDGFGDDAADLSFSCADAAVSQAGVARHELAGAVQLDRAGDFLADKRIEVEISRATRAEVQRIGGLEEQLVLEEPVQALPARQPHRFECRAPQDRRDGCAADSEGLGHARYTC